MFFRRRIKVNKGVIIAAGDGGRLGSLTATRPKALLNVNDRPLISYPIAALAAAGVNEIAIVVGYLGDKVVNELADGSDFGVNIQYLSNPDYLGGAAVSVHKAKDWTQGDPVILLMGDHLIEPRLVKHLMKTRTLCDTLCVDRTPEEHHELDEASKVVLDSSGCIKDIGKNLTYWDAIDTGVFLLTKEFFQALDELIPWLGADIEIIDVIWFLTSRGYRFRTCDVSGSFWADVDTKEDLNTVRV